MMTKVIQTEQQFFLMALPNLKGNGFYIKKRIQTLWYSGIWIAIAMKLVYVRLKNNVFDEVELDRNQVVADFATSAAVCSKLFV